MGREVVGDPPESRHPRPKERSGVWTAPADDTDCPLLLQSDGTSPASSVIVLDGSASLATLDSPTTRQETSKHPTREG